ncbi:MAG: glycosyltransferase family 2 protein, partial [bacterium]|nr:glycosyltransferase family 2 protein [bacterium]
MKTVFAVIVTRNGAGWITPALESLRESSVPVQAVVVDNASEDGTCEKIASFPSACELVRLNRNTGFGQANNRGVRHALQQGADFILLLNQDAKIVPETVGGLLRQMEQNSEFGIISPLQLDYDGCVVNPRFIKYLESAPKFFSDASLWKAADIYEVPFVNAAVWLVRRNVFEKVGGFDPLFFMYGEDNDLCRRVIHHGFKVGVASRVTACHQHGGNDPRAQTVKIMSNRYYAQAVNLLKRSEFGFAHNTLALIVTWLRM